MTVGALTVFLAYLNKFFKPVRDLAKMTNTIAQAAVGLERIRAILDTDTIIPQRPDAREPGTLRGEIAFDRVTFRYKSAETPLYDRFTLRIAPGTPNGRVLRVRGRGAPRKDGSKGDLLVTVVVQVPDTLDDAARAAVTAFREARAGDDPRARLFQGGA